MRYAGHASLWDTLNRAMARPLVPKTPPETGRYRVMIPTDSSDCLEVIDTQAERPTRAVLCVTTSPDHARRIVSALNQENN